MPKYAMVLESGSFEVMSLGTTMYLQPQDGHGNEKYVFNEDEFIRWYILLQDDSTGLGIPGKTVYIRRHWWLEFPVVTGSDGWATYDMYAYDFDLGGIYTPFTVFCDFDGDAEYDPASTSDIITVNEIPAEPTVIGYSITNNQGVETDTFYENQYTHWLIQLRLEDNTPIANAPGRHSVCRSGASSIPQVLEEDLHADRNQHNAAGPLGPPAQEFADAPSEPHSRQGEPAGHDADHNGRQHDPYLQEREGKADRERVQAGGNREQNQR